MSSPRHDDPMFVLAVGDDGSPPFAALLRRLLDAGIRFEPAPDVYSAMAHLATHELVRHVILDVRLLDRTEAAFLQLAPRYYPSVDFIVPLLPGTQERLNALVPERRAVAPEQIVPMLKESRATGVHDEPNSTFGPAESGGAAGQAVHEHELSPPFQTKLVAGSVEPEPTPPEALSTDGGPEAADGGPPLHEAVRLRMGGGTPVMRRRPPGKSPAPDGPDAGQGGAA